MMFAWDEVNREHIARHGVNPEEAEEVVNGAASPFPEAAPQTPEGTMSTKKDKTDENDFEALDRLARGVTPEKLRPLTPEMRRRWEAARRGRPKKAPGTKAVPTLITVEPQLLRRVDAYAKKAGLSRSQLFAEAVRQRIEAAG